MKREIFLILCLFILLASCGTEKSSRAKIVVPGAGESLLIKSTDINPDEIKVEYKVFDEVGADDIIVFAYFSYTELLKIWHVLLRLPSVFTANDLSSFFINFNSTSSSPYYVVALKRGENIKDGLINLKYVDSKKSIFNHEIKLLENLKISNTEIDLVTGELVLKFESFNDADLVSYTVDAKGSDSAVGVSKVSSFNGEFRIDEKFVKKWSKKKVEIKICKEKISFDFLNSSDEMGKISVTNCGLVKDFLISL